MSDLDIVERLLRYEAETDPEVSRMAAAEIERLRGLLRAICQPGAMKEYNGELRQWIDVGAFLEPGDALLFVTGDTLAAAREALGDAHQD